MEVVDTLQHNDSLNDVFEREPFSVLVRSTREGMYVCQTVHMPIVCTCNCSSVCVNIWA